MTTVIIDLRGAKDMNKEVEERKQKCVDHARSTMECAIKGKAGQSIARCMEEQFKYCFRRGYHCGYSEAREELEKPGGTINELAKMIHENAKAHGWWETERPFGEVVALCHSELSEALEAFRNDERMVWLDGDKPEGIAVEMVDCIIRILDYLAHEEINVEDVLRLKHEYNKNRPYKHGGKKI